jgi:chromosome segregation ATPase
MTDYRIDDEKGVIYAGFDILDTPRGKILKSLLDYGCVMGVSSRGQGDITNTSDGEVVDEDTYDFACFDVVTTPAVEKARQNVVESVKKTRTFVESIRKQIKEAETVGDLNAIKRVVETTQMPEMESLIESIENRCESIKDGKTITSERVEDSQIQVTESIKTEQTTNTNELSAKTIREAKEMYSCVNSLRKQLNAYKFREKKLLSVINSKNEELSTMKENVQDYSSKCNSQKYANSRLMSKNKQLVTELYNSKKDTANKVNTLEQSIKLKNKELSKLNSSIDKQDMITEKLESKLNNSVNKVSKLQNTLKQTTSINEDLQNQISNKNLEIEQLEQSLNSSVLKEDSYRQRINELQKKNKMLTQQLEALETNALVDKRTNTNNINEMESEINSYTEIIDNLQTQLESLRTQKEESVNVNKKLLDKCKQLTERISNYQKVYVNTKAKQLGIDPSLVTEHITDNSSVECINKLIENVQKTKDRYAKLPISESVPKGVLIDANNKQVKKDTEMEKLESFVEKLTGGI